MKQKITEIANLTGIEIIGFTNVLDYTYLYEFLDNRTQRGHNSEFEEPDINKRLDARNVFQKCKSIIAIGVPYAEGFKKPVANDKGLLSVSSYGEDYHKKLGALLKKLAEEIKKDINFEYEICVDTSPLIDREICKNAGLGISYLTQTKNYISLEYRKNMRNQIYGCDVCQIVCPKNKINSQKETNQDYSSLLIDMEELMQMSNKEFASKYGYLAGSWRGKTVWKRNALIAIGNLGLESMFKTVENELNSPSDMIKIYAAWCLMKLNKEKASEILHNSMKYENDTIRSEYMKLAEARL